MSWTNKLVRHADGRLGRIREDSVFESTILNIAAEDGPHQVTLNARCKDHGEAEWYWFCEDFNGGPHWCGLGDHWENPLAKACTPDEIVQMLQFRTDAPWRNWAHA